MTRAKLAKSAGMANEREYHKSHKYIYSITCHFESTTQSTWPNDSKYVGLGNWNIPCHSMLILSDVVREKTIREESEREREKREREQEKANVELVHPISY